ncbi:MAG: methyltransferase [Pseudonocardiaceae bacterium]
MGNLGEVVEWTEGGEVRIARWHSDSGALRPERVVVVDDRITADGAFRLARDGVAMVWCGDFQNARQLLTALARRLDRGRCASATTAAEAFHLHRRSQARRARALGMLLVPVEVGLVIPLRRAPDVRQACAQAHCPADQPLLVSLRQLLGIISAHEWRKKGVAIPALGDRIHPHYGVFSPVRGEYVELVAAAPLPARASAYDIGTGTGVLAAVLARRGVERIVATEQDGNALACARENITRLGLDDRVDVVRADLFPEGRAGLVVCNPPWVPAWPSSPLEHAIYDPESRMLRAFLGGLTDHLEPGGEGWLVLSDLAEHLGLRSRNELLSAVEESGLGVAGRADITPRHPRVFDRADPLHAARAAEVTSLWRLTAR